MRKKFFAGNVDLAPNQISSFNLEVEKYLKLLGSFKFHKISSLSDAFPEKLDLLVVYAGGIEQDEFKPWLMRLAQKMKEKNSLALPTLFFAEISFATLSEMIYDSHMQNWYFDIISKEHLSSLPIRVSNLLKINDHIKELHRYENELIELQKNYEKLEQKLIASAK